MKQTMQTYTRHDDIQENADVQDIQNCRTYAKKKAEEQQQLNPDGQPGDTN